VTNEPLALARAWREAVQEVLPEAVALRRMLHEQPRVSGDEAETAAAVARWIGLGEGEVVAGTGRLLCVTEGARPDAPAVVLRAELDALPVKEATGVTWAATNGAMHACGHDVHLAALAAVARSAPAPHLPRPLLALLQPREEGVDSGAADVVAEGRLVGVGAVVAGHVQPRLPAGVVATTPGSVNAAMDEFTVTVRGRGGHSGYPHTVADPVLATSAVVVALQQVGARRIDPTVGVACMVTQVHGGTANNVVPGEAACSGTLRTMRPEDRAAAHRAIEEIAVSVAAGHGCTADVTIAIGEPVLVNDIGLASAAADLLTGLGREIDATWRSFGSDDFAAYGDQVRALMLFVGTGGERGGLHEATYLPDDEYVGLVAEALIAGYCAALG
jgi:amidohydrolase